jgi:hypothetical protein
VTGQSDVWADEYRNLPADIKSVKFHEFVAEIMQKTCISCSPTFSTRVQKLTELISQKLFHLGEQLLAIIFNLKVI